MKNKAKILARVFLLACAFATIPLPALAQQASTTPQPREYAPPPTTKEIEWVKAPVRAGKGMVVSDESLASSTGV